MMDDGCFNFLHSPPSASRCFCDCYHLRVEWRKAKYPTYKGERIDLVESCHDWTNSRRTKTGRDAFLTADGNVYRIEFLIDLIESNLFVRKSMCEIQFEVRSLAIQLSHDVNFCLKQLKRSPSLPRSWRRYEFCSASWIVSNLIH
jgi:hypothetical protein